MIHFVTVDDAGTILRTGQCSADDLSIQPGLTLGFDVDPQVTDTSHTYDPATRSFISNSGD